MCKIRIVHFSTHDVRLPIATQLFTTPGSASSGDFLASTIPNPCDCDPRFRSGPLIPPSPSPSSSSLNNHPNHDLTPRPRFRICHWYTCCAMWYQPVLCGWVRENADELWDVRAPERRCPNCLIVGEHMPIGMVLRKRGRVPRAVRVRHWREDPAWNRHEARKQSRPFPVGELFYERWDWQQATVVGGDSLGLERDREELEVMRRELWERKGVLERACRGAAECVEGLEREFYDTEDGELGIALEDPMVLLLRVGMAQKLVREAERAEMCAAEAYRNMMKHAAYAFMALGKMPEHEESVTAGDGSYSVSREQLDLRGLSTQGVIEACDGTLKQAGKLGERLKAIEDILHVRQQIKRHGLKGMRSKPVFGTLTSRIRKLRPGSF